MYEDVQTLGRTTGRESRVLMWSSGYIRD